MKGLCLHLYTYEHEQYHNTVLYEWLLEHAKKHHLCGGSVSRMVAGYGQDQILHEEHFFELGSNVPIQVSFIADSEAIHQFLQELQSYPFRLFYTLTEIEFGTLPK